MAAHILWTAFAWTFRGILCTCRFLWICPYNAIKFLPRESPVARGVKRQLKELVGSKGKGAAAIPGSPDRTAALHKRLTKTEREILSLQTRLACERASWERRFAELQGRQEDLRHQLVLKVGGCGDRAEPGPDNGDAFEDCSGGLSGPTYRHGASEVSSRGDAYASCASGRFSPSSVSSAASVRSWRASPGHHRVFAPHSPVDLQVGHRVRVLLPSGRISTGAVRFLGHLQGEPDLQLGVELQTPEHGLHDGSHRGHTYFECKPGYGAFVPFHKLLMAWE
ncbi:uncharacterized protein LOC114843176 [Betta splendens]|uniref:Uncharacterized protein LOC114843176 n=1 Tax=Betta splendens TaxID=158456 RepID=A0A6P7KUN2_BETSP|nr:uncharacterized protein LOC114843176 [Betta splendens]